MGAAAVGNRGFEPETGKIRLLDPLTIDQIAAGEVIERPASAVKELVENALDAGAGRIEIQLEEAGRRLIAVRDDGAGMTQGEVVTALQRHATSKITGIADLHRIDSLGFRGEALPSIASVSRMSISTGTEDGLRSVVDIEGGAVLNVAGSSGPKGTDVRVEDLFFNTPARLKFLKSDGNELSVIVDMISRYAVAYPDVAFRIVHEGAEVLRTTGRGSAFDAVSEVWGLDPARGLVEIDEMIGGIRVRGFASPPHFTKPTRAMQWLFVNRRPIRSRSLNVAIDQAYRDILPEKRYPLVVLMLDVSPAAVDVNVSPTKNEVRFQHDRAAFDAVRHAIRAALNAHGMVPSLEAIARVNSATGIGQGFASGSADFVAGSFIPGVGAGSNFGQALDAQAPLSGFAIGSRDVEEPSHAMPTILDESFRAVEFAADLKVIGQALNTFIVAETRLGIVLVDQHVAHERILFERLRASRGATHGPTDLEAGGESKSGAMPSIARQTLLTPESFELDHRLAPLLSERLCDVREAGFDVETFGGGSFVIRAVPAALKGRNPVKFLREVVEELAESAAGCLGSLQSIQEAVWALCACKMAVKAGDPLSPPEMEKLLRDLAEIENPYHCPHGRPITLLLSRNDLLRKFKRIK